MEYSISPTSDTTRFVYDQLNRVTAVYDPLNQNPTLTHYGAIFPDSVTDPKGERYVFVHNALGWVTERYGPASATNKDSYGYDIAGNVKNWTNRNGQTVQYDYDLLGRVTTIELPGDTLEYGYDPGGQDRFAWASNAWSTDTTWYAPWGAVDSSKTGRGGSVYRVGYEYGHWSGRPTKLHDRFNNRTLSFAYNDLGQLDTMTVRGLKTWVDTRNADLQTTTRRFPAQFSQTLNYSADHSRAEIKWPKTGGGSLASRNYGFDEAGRITDMDPEGNTKYEYEYDRRGRLLRRETYSQDEECTYSPYYPYIECQGVENLQSVDTFTYDAIGNRTDHGAQIDPGSRLRRIAVHGDTVLFSYDSAGNVTRREKLISGDVQDFYWNALGQLASVVKTGVYEFGDTVRFRYDALGRRIALETAGDTIEYVWASGHVLFDTKNGTVTEYSYLPGTDRLHALYRSGEFHYYLTDHVGSTAALADSVAAKENAYTYDPWGFSESGSEQIENRFRFAGRECDLSTAFYYMRARYYDPATGRFLSEDPIGLAGGLNPYAYAANNPIALRDPSGLDEDSTDTNVCDFETGAGCNLGQIEGVHAEVDRWWARRSWLGFPGSRRSGGGISWGGIGRVASRVAQSVKNAASEVVDHVGEHWDCYNAALGFGLTFASDVAFFTGVGYVVRAGHNAWRFGVAARMTASNAAVASAYQLRQGFQRTVMKQQAWSTGRNRAATAAVGPGGSAAMSGVNVSWKDFVPGLASVRAGERAIAACR